MRHRTSLSPPAHMTAVSTACCWLSTACVPIHSDANSTCRLQCGQPAPLSAQQQHIQLHSVTGHRPHRHSRPVQVRPAYTAWCRVVGNASCSLCRTLYQCAHTLYHITGSASELTPGLCCLLGCAVPSHRHPARAGPVLGDLQQHLARPQLRQQQLRRNQYHVRPHTRGMQGLPPVHDHQ
jgi:hypothetical protein